MFSVFLHSIFQCFVGSATFDLMLASASQSPVFKMLHYLHVVGKSTERQVTTPATLWQPLKYPWLEPLACT